MTPERPVLLPKKVKRPPEAKKGFLRAPHGGGSLPAGACTVPLPSEVAALAAALGPVKVKP